MATTSTTTTTPNNGTARSAAEAFMSRAQATKNNKGFDIGVLAWGWDQWVAAYDGEHPLLDVGSGYGTNTLAALKRGAKVVALDMTEEHLATIRERAGEEAVSSGQLRTVLGELPEVAGVPEGGFSAVLCAQVIHFLSPEAYEKTIASLARWVKPGGMVIVLATSIYQKGFLKGADGGEAVMTAMENEARAGGYPGYYKLDKEMLENWLLASDEPLPAEFLKELSTHEGRYHHFYHPSQLERSAKASGLDVVSVQLLSAKETGLPEFTIVPSDSPYGGKEQVVLVAKKPLSS